MVVQLTQLIHIVDLYILNKENENFIYDFHAYR